MIRIISRTASSGLSKCINTVWHVATSNELSGSGIFVASPCAKVSRSGDRVGKAARKREAASETLNVTIDDCTDVNENPDITTGIYPNPAVDYIVITGKGGKTITISDLPGNELITLTTANDSQTIDLSKFEKGIYFVKVEQASGTSVFRLVKK